MPLPINSALHTVWKGLDTRAALIITYMAVNLPIVVWLLRDYFASIPIELEESARVDGASPYRTLWSITLPLSVPGLVATFLFVLVFAWNGYLLALFLSGADTQTMPLLVAAQNATRGPQWWTMSVLILIMILPVIVLAIVLERYISRGLLVGAVKRVGMDPAVPDRMDATATSRRKRRISDEGEVDT